jgi:hypothetical protein
MKVYICIHTTEIENKLIFVLWSIFLRNAFISDEKVFVYADKTEICYSGFTDFVFRGDSLLMLRLIFSFCTVLITSTLKMERVRTSETSVTLPTSTWCKYLTAELYPHVVVETHLSHDRWQTWRNSITCIRYWDGSWVETFMKCIRFIEMNNIVLELSYQNL